MESTFPTAINFEVTLGHNARDAQLMLDAAAAVRKIGKDMIKDQSSGANNIDVVNITFLGVGRNATSSDRKILHLSYDAQTLKQTVHTIEDADATLGAANDAGWWTPENDDVIKAYCGARPASTFCAKFE